MYSMFWYKNYCTHHSTVQRISSVYFCAPVDYTPENVSHSSPRHRVCLRSLCGLTCLVASSMRGEVRGVVCGVWCVVWDTVRTGAQPFLGAADQQDHVDPDSSGCLLNLHTPLPPVGSFGTRWPRSAWHAPRYWLAGRWAGLMVRRPAIKRRRELRPPPACLVNHPSRMYPGRAQAVARRIAVQKCCCRPADMQQSSMRQGCHRRQAASGFLSRPFTFYPSI